MINKIYGLLLLLVLGSCSSEVISVKYYLIEKHSLPNETAAEPQQLKAPLPFNAIILPFTVTRPYEQDRIALRSKSNELSYYEYHNWAELPSTAITHFVKNKISNANIFTTIDYQLLRLDIHYVITGHIDQIERLDLDDKGFAHLKMTLTLKDKKTGNILINHSFDKYTEMNYSDQMNIFAQNINQILIDQTRVFSKKIDAQLTAQK